MKRLRQHGRKTEYLQQEVEDAEVDDKAGHADARNLAKRVNSLRLVLASVTMRDMVLAYCPTFISVH